MRVSKAPEVRKQEMIDTAMQLFAQKGYEATTMTDIAKKMQVVSGLCYRYFRSKEELYHTALEMYASECARPIIHILEQEQDDFESHTRQMQDFLRINDGKGKYHDFFHAIGNEMFHKQLEYKLAEKIVPAMTALLEQMQKKGLISIADCHASAQFIVYGEMPIINDETIPLEERITTVSALIRKLLGLYKD